MATASNLLLPPNLNSALELLSQSYLARLLIIFGTIVLGLLSKIAYNIWLHPLAKYPGPLLSCATEFVYWNYWIRGGLPFYIERVHKDYGTKVRISPSRLSFIEPEAWKDIHGHRVGIRKMQIIKDPVFYVDDPHIGAPSLLTTSDDSAHGKLRKIFSHGFSDRALKAQEGLIDTHVTKLVGNIYRESKQGNKIDMVKLFNYTTFDIIGELAFGESLGLLSNSKLNKWVESILFDLEDAAIYALGIQYPIIGFLFDLFTPQHLKDASTENAKYAEERVAKRLEKGNVTAKPDFWTLVLGQHESGVLTHAQMRSNADLFMQAGSETTATMLSGLTYNLLMNPIKMKKVVEEVRSSFTSEDELTIENIQRLKYLGACFEESMRIYPSIPLGPPRVILNGGGSVCGDFLPGGTRLSIAQWAAYHSPVNFKNPLEFVPERWIDDAPEHAEYVNDRRQVFQPFSHGPRNCIGKNLALHEMRLIACKMLWHFDLELCEETRGSWFQQKCFWALWSKPPLWVKATPVRTKLEVA